MQSIVRVVTGILLLGISFLLMAQEEDNDVKVSREITTMYRSARAVISTNQALINDASKGDKGLSGKAVRAKASEICKGKLGYMPEGEHIDALLQAVESVMDNAQPLINEKGKGFKGFLPAIFAKQVADKFSESQAGKMKIKLTAPKKYVRNRANRPDKWEHKIIEKKFKADDWEKDKTFSENTTYKGKKAFRFILPEYYKESCLKCHGEPKGELDVTGGKKEGGVLGELGGAISFTIIKE